ncbi:MAG: condensation domain-containing protein, partial [Sporichthyaceae bacterium]|nr:condensation domain-containing protein [Sporichthyaceae bacterium]
FGSRALDPARDVAATTASTVVRLPADSTAALLTDVPAAYRAGVNEVLLTALALAVADWRRRRGGDDGAVLVTLEGHGREEFAEGIDLSRTVGWFTSLCPVRLDHAVTDWSQLWSGGPALRRAIKRIKEQLRAVPDHGIGYGLLRYLNPATATALADLPQPQMAFNYLGRFAAAGTGADWSPAAEAPALSAGTDAEAPMTHALTVNAWTEEDADGPQLVAAWSWPRELATQAEVNDLAQTWVRALEVIAGHAIEGGSGGLTPSDLPLTSLTQAEIDLLEAEWRATR